MITNYRSKNKSHLVDAHSIESMWKNSTPMRQVSRDAPHNESKQTIKCCCLLQFLVHVQGAIITRNSLRSIAQWIAPKLATRVQETEHFFNRTLGRLICFRFNLIVSLAEILHARRFFTSFSFSLCFSEVMCIRVVAPPKKFRFSLPF